MGGPGASLLAILVLGVLHAYAGRLSGRRHRWSARTLSMAAGISTAYVFLELMPTLAEQRETVERIGLVPGASRDIYVLALAGLTVSFWVETAARASRRRNREAGLPDVTGKWAFRLGVAAFAILNAATGYAVGSPGDEAVEPLWMFTLAMGLHFVVNDHSLVEHHGERYERVGRWLLSGSLLAGWAIGIAPAVEIPAEVLAPVLAYLAGGTVMNIIRHELPDTDRVADVAAFVVGAAAYGFLLLALGPSHS